MQMQRSLLRSGVSPCGQFVGMKPGGQNPPEPCIRGGLSTAMVAHTPVTESTVLNSQVSPSPLRSASATPPLVRAKPRSHEVCAPATPGLTTGRTGNATINRDENTADPRYLMRLLLLVFFRRPTAKTIVVIVLAQSGCSIVAA